MVAWEGMGMVFKNIIFQKVICKNNLNVIQILFFLIFFGYVGKGTKKIKISQKPRLAYPPLGAE